MPCQCAQHTPSSISVHQQQTLVVSLSLMLMPLVGEQRHKRRGRSSRCPFAPRWPLSSVLPWPHPPATREFLHELMMLINPHLMLASAHLSVFRFCQSIISVRWVGCLPLLVPTPIAVMLMCELSSLACDAVLLMGELRPAVHSVAVHRCSAMRGAVPWRSGYGMMRSAQRRACNSYSCVPHSSYGMHDHPQN
jgi:hypothetical protein